MEAILSPWGVLPYMGHIGMCHCEGYGFQAEDGIRDVERSRGLGDVYKRQFLKFIVSCIMAEALLIL